MPVKLLKQNNIQNLQDDKDHFLISVKDYIRSFMVFDDVVLNTLTQIFVSNSGIANALNDSDETLLYKNTMKWLQKVRRGDIKNVNKTKYAQPMIDLCLQFSNLILYEYTANGIKGVLNVHFSATILISHSIEYRTIHSNAAKKVLTDEQIGKFLISVLNNNFEGYRQVMLLGGYPYEELVSVFAPVTVWFD